jgi:exodeoxyribonuclease-3
MPKKYPLLISWNVNGIRAATKKGFLKWLEKASPDILCLQETKASVDQLSENIIHPNGYTGIWNSAPRKGYSGVATLVKSKPLAQISQFGDKILDEEGRIILTEHKDFYLFNVYFPNGGRDQGRLNYKIKFCKRFYELLDEYNGKKPILLCGDLNTAHHEIDIARPKANEKHSGFMPIERVWLDKLGNKGFIDTFRYKYPNKKEMYSWWDTMTHARERNVGWRLDYFWASKSLAPKIKEAMIMTDVFGSDHCPVGIKIDVKL